MHRIGSNIRGYIGVKGHLIYLLIPVLTVWFLTLPSYCNVDNTVHSHCDNSLNLEIILGI